MSKDLQLSQMALPLGSLEAYIHRVNQLPLLSAEEEQALAEQFRDEGSLTAARKLVLAHLRYVARIARGYMGYGLSLGDLIQEGNVGLMKAVKRFDPTVGVRLVSFAVHWIKAEIHEFILRNWRIVKVATTKAQRKLFFNLRSFKKRLGWFTQAEVDMVAEHLNVSAQEVRRMEERLNAMDYSYDTPESDDEEQVYLLPANYLEDKQADPALMIERQDTSDQGKHHLLNALQTLDKRSQDILRRRWLTDKKATLHELAACYQVSAERIRQLEKNALAKLRETIDAARR
jgi:RNA polymerase sigma-32 factor